jgi:hypothetical protein
MATTAMDYENANGDRFDGESHLSAPQRHASSVATQSRCRQSISPPPRTIDADMCIAEDAPRYERDRSASPRRDDGHESSRRRSMSPNGHDRYVFPIESSTGHPSIHPSASWPPSDIAFTAPRPSTTTTTRMTMGPSTPDPTSSSPASTRVLRRPRSPASLRSMARLRSARS